MYILTVILSIVSMILGIMDAVHIIEQQTRPNTEALVMNYLLCLAFSMKVPYLKGKTLSLLALVALILGYGAMAILKTIAFARADSTSKPAA